MRIAKIETDDSWVGMKKVNEEIFEFMEAVIGQKKEEILAEGFDIIQALFSYFYSNGYTKEEIQSHIKLHYQKLENRHEECLINIEAWEEY